MEANSKSQSSIPECLARHEFRNEYHRALVNIIYVSNCINNVMKDCLCTQAMTFQQYNILKILQQHQPLSILQLRNLMLDKMSDTSRLVDRLVDKQLVEKHVCAKDKRLVDIYLTQTGENLIQTLEAEICEVDQKIKVLSPDEIDTLNQLLEKLRCIEK